MASPPLSDDVLREAVEAKQQAGSELGAAKLLNIARGTIQHRLREAARRGIAPESGIDHPVAEGFALKGYSHYCPPQQKAFAA